MHARVGEPTDADDEHGHAGGEVAQGDRVLAPPDEQGGEEAYEDEGCLSKPDGELPARSSGGEAVREVGDAGLKAVGVPVAPSAGPLAATVGADLPPEAGCDGALQGNQAYREPHAGVDELGVEGAVARVHVHLDPDGADHVPREDEGDSEHHA